MQNKICGCCKEQLPLSSFGKDTTRKDGLRPTCKDCVNRQSRERHLKNPDLKNEYQRKYHKENRDQIIMRRKEWIKKRPGLAAEYKRRWKRAHPETFKAMNRVEKAKARLKVENRLKEALRGRIWRALKRGFKSGSAIRDLGCSIPELKAYLEARFQPGMSWENYGKWHLDHMTPLASFDLSDREQFLKACHYTNLQPLWAVDNIRKSNKLNWGIENAINQAV